MSGSVGRPLILATELCASNNGVVQIWIRWLKYISFIFYGYNLLLKIEFGDRQLKCEDFYRAKPDAPPVSPMHRPTCMCMFLSVLA